MPRRLNKSPADIRAARRARRETSERNTDDTPPSDIHEFRYAMARRIWRQVGNQRQYWRGCPERMCRRQRACTAPGTRCSNAPVLPPDPEREARALAEVQRVLRSLPAREEEG
jgi:hypothetical protein